MLLLVGLPPLGLPLLHGLASGPLLVHLPVQFFLLFLQLLNLHISNKRPSTSALVIISWFHCTGLDMQVGFINFSPPK